MADPSKASGEQGRSVPQSPDSSCDADVQDCLQDAYPTLLGLDSYRLPAEIISQILSYLVPDGLQISNDPARESDIQTIRSLLKTSIAIKHELLRHIFRQPLFIYITNGKVCGCNRIYGRGWDEPVSTLLLKKISHLPLHRWPSITICFAPNSQEKSCLRYPGDFHIERWIDDLEPEDQDPLGWKFLHAVDCVIRKVSYPSTPELARLDGSPNKTAPRFVLCRYFLFSFWLCWDRF
jgi:hypothetical protein